jgi:hypothetical protein
MVRGARVWTVVDALVEDCSAVTMITLRRQIGMVRDGVEAFVSTMRRGE